MASRRFGASLVLLPAGPGVYAYCYDDAMGLLQCSADSYYQLEFFCYWFSMMGQTVGKLGTTDPGR